MKLTVLGNYGPYPAEGGACSGYLLETQEAKILLDCGSGVLSNLQKYCHIEDITHVILSHLHYDHISDMMVLAYALEGKRKRGGILKNIKVYLPKEPNNEYVKISSKEVFDTTIITDDLKLEVNRLCISFHKVTHPILCYGTKVQENGKTFVYSGDTSYTNFPTDFVKDCDLFLCDAGFLSKDKKSDNVPHLTAIEAGLAAKKSQVKRLILTHFWPEDDTNEHLKEAKENFLNSELAVQDRVYEI